MVVLALITAGCRVAPGRADSGKPLVLTTFTVIADMARQVGGEFVQVESIVKPGAEIHGYDPTPSDLRRVADADLVLNNGFGLEKWFEQFMTGVDAPRVTLSDGVQPIPIRSGDSSGHPNPHAWMSPTAALTYVTGIERALSDLVPEHRADFAAAAESYRSEIRRLGDELTATLATVPEEQRALVTCEGAFSYLARDAGLSERYLWAVNAEADPTPQDVAAVVDFVEQQRVPAVFCESTVSDAAQRQVAAQSGARFGGVLYVDSLSEPDGPVPTYLDLLRHDLTTIAAGLGGARPGAGR
ncbi:metal ABC transporter substrate-binding protein [Microlunatus parietis]|uniref:Manganese transport system substrate-binding protein n=1 Tax=Microlunatus parietis TaxID=682979 RepID=A0A7Y9LF79_9ACTN|nr:metal ABC transporter substrate-binding protein [Microlunatus parietis]NYE74578.1 manganese transport system substrate-binding protein [Microlunatus parietis]